MDLLKTYTAVNEILDGLDFGAVFAGFHKYKFALYDNEQICLDGKLMPYREDFMGNTSIFFENEFIAIWDMDIDPIEDMELLAYLLVHEMFHCFQKDNNDNRYPSDLVLLSYPDDIDNYLCKYNENRYLADAYENEDIESFKKFHTLRNRRLNNDPETVTQELRAETMEGMAEYVGLKALQKINYRKFLRVSEECLAKLRAEDELLFDIRRISYYSGALYFLCLDIFGVIEKCSFRSDITAYEQNRGLFEEAIHAEVHPYDLISRKFAETTENKKRIVSEHIASSEFVACDASICGYDPMNMFRIGDIIYCSHFICLKINGNTEMFRSKIALKVKAGETKEIMGYYIISE